MIGASPLPEKCQMLSAVPLCCKKGDIHMTRTLWTISGLVALMGACPSAAREWRGLAEADPLPAELGDDVVALERAYDADDAADVLLAAEDGREADMDAARASSGVRTAVVGLERAFDDGLGGDMRSGDWDVLVQDPIARYEAAPTGGSGFWADKEMLARPLSYAGEHVKRLTRNEREEKENGSPLDAVPEQGRDGLVSPDREWATGEVDDGIPRYEEKALVDPKTAAAEAKRVRDVQARDDPTMRYGGKTWRQVSDEEAKKATPQLTVFEEPARNVLGDIGGNFKADRQAADGSFDPTIPAQPHPYDFKFADPGADETTH